MKEHTALNTSKPTPHPITPGTLLANQHYILNRPNQTYALNDTHREVLWEASDRERNVPVLLHELALPPTHFTARQQASRTIIQLRSKLAPPLPPLDDFFVEQEHLYFVTQAPRGETLQQRVAQHVLSERDMLRGCLDLCDMLAVLHQRNLFHGGLAPTSVLQRMTGPWSVTHLPLIPLLLASNLLPPAHDWRFPLLFPGARSATPLADVDALVAIAAYALTGHVPQQHGTFPFNRQLSRQFSEEMLHLLTRGLQPDATQRYQSLDELRRDLARLFILKGGVLPSPQQNTTRRVSHSPSGRLFPASPAALAQQPTMPQMGVRQEKPVPHQPPYPAIPAPLVMPTRFMDRLVPLAWMLGINLVLLFLVTRGGLQ